MQLMQQVLKDQFRIEDVLKKTERYTMQNQSHIETWWHPSLIGRKITCK